jgi:hypothetical protein
LASHGSKDKDGKASKLHSLSIEAGQMEQSGRRGELGGGLYLGPLQATSTGIEQACTRLCSPTRDVVATSPALMPTLVPTLFAPRSRCNAEKQGGTLRPQLR